MPRGKAGTFVCRWHLIGVHPEHQAIKWCVRGCLKCEEKIARGEVTGDEGPPPNLRKRYGRRTYRLMLAKKAVRPHPRKGDGL